MLETLDRRTFLGQFAAVSAIAGTGAALAAQHEDAATIAITKQIDDAQKGYREARRTLDDAIQGFEQAHPKLHWTLDLTHQRPTLIRGSMERRPFDGATPQRGIETNGQPGNRYVATVQTLLEDLKRCCERGDRRKIRRMLRRARQHQEAVAQAQLAFGLRSASLALRTAEHHIEDLCESVFARPATTFAALQLQARMLCALLSCIDPRQAAYHAGLRGAQLAENLRNLELAA